ncbi:hypothetical protein RND81_04G093400 [Saponaria officinalis]|uniref:Uncharacterized protein n=1 Tax=Saponaria officinalis TaxID=3572 RepID=A0AAW1LDK4_SAPOF
MGSTSAHTALPFAHFPFIFQLPLHPNPTHHTIHSHLSQPTTTATNHLHPTPPSNCRPPYPPPYHRHPSPHSRSRHTTTAINPPLPPLSTLITHHHREPPSAPPSSRAHTSTTCHHSNTSHHSPTPLSIRIHSNPNPGIWGFSKLLNRSRN